MGAGFQSFTSDTNRLQIDERFVNYQLVSKTTLVANGGGGSSSYQRFTGIQLEVNRGEIVAFASPSPFVFAQTFSLNGGDTYLVGIASTVANQQITAYRFKPGPPSGSNAGMQIFNAAGGLVFDAASAFMRVGDSQPFQPSAGAQTWAMAGGRNYAIAFGKWGGYVIESSYISGGGGGGGGGTDLWIQDIRFQGPMFTTSTPGQISKSAGYAQYQATSKPWTSRPPDSANIYDGGNMLFIDVTNL
ncbi:hypothetical protein [Pseudomonas sp. S36]|uniref:hypothetical protein n=1 Tax=Pseudomonas sp. S36 TaxID=2767447 RepID=UPI001911991B|nr:hypothetical protein [Pseudomonas sp. S36]